MGGIVWLLLHIISLLMRSVTGVGEDHELIFPGSDDDFDVGESDYECDPLDREQGKPAITETFISLYKCKIVFHKYKIIPLKY